MSDNAMRLAEDLGPVLTGRASAIELNRRIDSELARASHVVLDFADVRALSPSFADELFGRLGSRVGRERVRFVNLSPHLQTVAKMASKNHAASEEPHDAAGA